MPISASNPISGQLVRTSDTDFRIGVDPIQFSIVANTFCSDNVFPHPMSFFALDNLNRHCGVPKALAGAFGLYSLTNGLLTAPRTGGWLGGAALGYRYFTSAYRNRIVELQVRDSMGDIDTGTGFLIRFSDGISRVVTCLHNLVEQGSGKLRTIQRMLGGEIEYRANSGIALDRLDIAILDIDKTDLDLPNGQAKILETVYSAGFPRIYMTKPSPLLFHKGEVNGFSGHIEDASKEIILSLDIAPGNSGGPIFNEVGCVVGVAARKSETSSKVGMASYAHAIPIEVIRNELDQRRYRSLDSF